MVSVCVIRVTDRCAKLIYDDKILWWNWLREIAVFVFAVVPYKYTTRSIPRLKFFSSVEIKWPRMRTYRTVIGCKYNVQCLDIFYRARTTSHKDETKEQNRTLFGGGRNPEKISTTCKCHLESS